MTYDKILASNQRFVDGQIYTIEKAISRMILYDNVGEIWLFRADVVNSGALLTQSELIRMVLGKEPLVFFNGIVVGKLTDIFFTHHDGLLHVLFEPSIDLHAIEPFVWAQPNLNWKRVQCCECKRWFRSHDAPCVCIVQNPVMKLESCSIESVTLYDTRHENITKITEQSEMLTTFFTNSLSHLSLTEPI